VGGRGGVAVKRPGDLETILEAPHILLATGARARSLAGVVFDGERILDYRAALALPRAPRSAVVIGAGAIGVEMASFWRALGVEVTIVEYLPSLVPAEDDEICEALLSSFKKRGIRCLLGQNVTGAQR